ncbi:MAG: hypothetical protein Q8M24_17780 [Pseudolabrys sp.]|nr:hypothetical protein [Pseudolabrys sp.]MDP2297296.1 hypothetical protein [Pseudolabrys sp.]
MTPPVKHAKRGIFTPAIFLSLLALVGALLLAGTPASAQSGARSSDAAVTRARPRVVIQPRRYRLSANARRECRAQLVQEYRVSGTVIVPRMTCWWE